MLRPRVMQGLLAALLVVFVYSSIRRPPATEPPPKRVRRPSRSVDAPVPVPLPDAAGDRRNPFEYAEAAQARPRAYVPPPVAVAATPTETPAPTIKLVGLVQQAGGPRAALALHGQIALGAQGQDVHGYTIVSIDEDAGVVLTGPDGRSVTLRREEP